MPSLHFFLAIVALLLHQTSAILRNGSYGFSARLIRRDSRLLQPQRHPFRPVAHARAPFQPSRLRVEYPKSAIRSSSSPDAAQSRVIPVNSEYLMEFSIGSSRYEVLANADTGINMIWIQCQPCLRFFKQKAPIFDPFKSSSHATLSCLSKRCSSFQSHKCEKGSCWYASKYAKGSMSSGDVGREAFIFDTDEGEAKMVFSGLLFECGSMNVGYFQENEQGIVGLNMGRNSLISQMGTLGKGRFSYCLVNAEYTDSGSHMLFEDHAMLDLGATPMAVRPGKPEFYFVNLIDIRVGEREAERTSGDVPAGLRELTMLKTEGYVILVKTLWEVIRLEPARWKRNMSCFKGTRKDMEQGMVPKLTFHFKGLDVWLQPPSTYMVVENMLCLSILPDDFLSFFGMHAQQNLNVGYDINRRRIHVSP